MKQSRGFTLVELLIVVGIVAVLSSILLFSLARAREKASRAKCADNLRTISQAIMLYRSDDQRSPHQFPRLHDAPTLPLTLDATGADLTAVPNSNNDPFSIPNGQAAPNGNPVVGYNNVPAALFLLIRTQKISPKVFTCPSSSAQADTLLRPSGQRQLMECGNFGSDGSATPFANGRVTKHLSYGYVTPYPANKSLTRWISGNPDFAVMADIGPGCASAVDNVYKNIRSTAPPPDIKAMNSNNHGKEGQNVLYIDGHIEWQISPFCGFRENHIYAPDYLDANNVRHWFDDASKALDVMQTDPRLAKPYDDLDTVILPWDK